MVREGRSLRGTLPQADGQDHPQAHGRAVGVLEFKRDSWNEQKGVVSIDQEASWQSLLERDLTPEKISMLAEAVFGFTCPEVIGLDSIAGQYLVVNCANGLWLKESVSQKDGQIVIESLD